MNKINFKRFQGFKLLKDLNIGNHFKKFFKNVKPKQNKTNKISKTNRTNFASNSIRAKIFLSFIILILTVVIVLGGLSLYQNYKVTFDTLEQTMVNLTQVSSSVISNKLEVYKTVSADLGINPVLSDLKVNKQEKAKVVKQIVEMYGLLDAFTVTAMGSGESPITGELYLINDTDYFLSAMEGNVFISEPAMNKKLDKVTFSVAAPIWKMVNMERPSME